MSVTTQSLSSMSENTKRPNRTRRMPFLAQVGMLAWRALIVNLRQPGTIIPSLFIGAFFLVIYEAQLGTAAELFLRGQSYLGFILPLSIVSAALGGAPIAGGTIATDIGRGYFDKLLLTPVSRWALLLGPMIAGGLLLALQTLIIVGMGLLLGLDSATGVAGLLAVVGLALLFGLGLSGLIVGIALLSGNPAATSSSAFLLFPLTFLTATFVPVEQLAGWIKIAAQFNPVTYVLEATRAILNTGWDATLILRALTVGGAMFVVLFGFALWGLQERTRRR